MSNTLVCNKDMMQRIAHTVIDGVKVVQHTYTINLDNPQEMRVSMIKMDAELYKDHKEICRADFAEFEDVAYALQEKLIAEKAEVNE